MQEVTLCLFVDHGKILLGMKKRRFGAGKCNGFGGKLENGESAVENAVRELKEEINVSIKTDDVEKVGCLDFYFKDKPEWNQKMHIFMVKSWDGEVQESEEMKPQWFDIKDIPFETMWLDDKHWLPMVLAGKKVEGHFNLIDEGSQIDEFDIREV